MPSKKPVPPLPPDEVHLAFYGQEYDLPKVIAKLNKVCPRHEHNKMNSEVKEIIKLKLGKVPIKGGLR